MWVPALMLQTLFWTLPQEVQVAIHDTVLSCSVRTGRSVYTVQSTRSKTAAFKERSCGPPKLSHSWHGSFGHHHLHKLLIVDLTVAIHVSFADHLIDFLISKLPQWNIRHKSQVRAIRMRFIAFPCLQRFALQLHVIGYHVYSWIGIFCSTSYSNLRIFQTYLIRTEKTSQHISDMLWDRCISQAKNDPRKRMISET